MRPVLYVLMCEGVSEPLVGAVTDDPAIANLWSEREWCWAVEVALNQCTAAVDARTTFFKKARRLNPEFTK